MIRHENSSFYSFKILNYSCFDITEEKKNVEIGAIKTICKGVIAWWKIKIKVKQKYNIGHD